MDNDGLLKAVSIGTFCLETNIATRLVLKNVRHALDIQLHFISMDKLNGDGYSSTFCDA